MTAHDYMSWSAQLDVPTTGIQRSYYLPDGESHGLSSASERDQTWFGLSQICLTSHADRLTIGGGVRPSKNVSLILNVRKIEREGLSWYRKRESCLTLSHRLTVPGKDFEIR